MKVATFNLYQFVETGYWWYTRHPDNTYSPKAWRRKQYWVKQQLLLMNADMVGFQEVFSIQALKILCLEAGYPYFASIDNPKTRPDDPQIFISSVVALASRYPIEHHSTLTLSTQAHTDLTLPEDFCFSRQPLYVQIQTPDFGTVHGYVVHLKSKRPTTTRVRYSDAQDWPERARDTLMRLSRGNIASLAQRGAEATLLYHDICYCLEQFKYPPLWVIGDFNDEPDSDIMAALTLQQPIRYIGGIETADWPEAAVPALHAHRLEDSFKIAANTRQQIRPFTHIHQGHGGCLDHILVSNQLNSSNPAAQGEIIDYQVWGAHLNQDGNDNLLKSDHATVSIDCAPTPSNRQDKQSAKFSDKKMALCPHTRQDFIELAGGIFQSETQFRQWSNQDKYAHFWSFFFDSDHGWVQTTHDHALMQTLAQQKHYTIQPVIAQDFLERYLIRKRVPKQVRYGASINPFNLAPSENISLANRADGTSFPFELNKEGIIRPDQLILDPSKFIYKPLTDQSKVQNHAWMGLLPIPSQGGIARSLLYMLLIYGIDELYPTHLGTLLSKAKTEPPSPWELAYNQWVTDRLGIRNPLIDTPEQAQFFLDNHPLMQSLCIADDTI